MEMNSHLWSDPPPNFDGNRPDILKYSVSVPNVPGRNYRDSFAVPDSHASYRVPRQSILLEEEDYARGTH
jgi:hypothetical protein